MGQAFLPPAIFPVAITGELTKRVTRPRLSGYANLKVWRSGQGRRPVPLLIRGQGRHATSLLVKMVARLPSGLVGRRPIGTPFDGEYIAFASSRMGFKDEIAYTDAPQPYGEIFVMRFDGTHVEQLTDNQWEEGPPGWEPSIPVPAARA